MTQASLADAPSKARLVVIATVFLLLAVGAWVIGWLSAADLARGWGTAEVTFGPGMFATPLAGAFMLAVARCAIRAIPRRRQPIEMMGRGTLGLGTAAVLAILLVPVAGSLVSARLEAAGYQRCDDGRTGRLAFGTWYRHPCPAVIK